MSGPPGGGTVVVFAESGERFPCAAFLALPLRAYLWYQLHQSREAVYLLRCAGDRCADDRCAGDRFAITTFGDRAAKAFVPAHRLKSLWTGVSEPEQQARWLLDRLAESAGLICPLSDFCALCDSHEDWRGFPAALASRKAPTGTLVLTAPLCADESARLLRTSPALSALFPALRALRDGPPRPLMSALCGPDGPGVVLTSSGTWERSAALLCRESASPAARALALHAPPSLETRMEGIRASLREPWSRAPCPRLEEELGRLARRWTEAGEDETALGRVLLALEVCTAWLHAEPDDEAAERLRTILEGWLTEAEQCERLARRLERPDGGGRLEREVRLTRSRTLARKQRRVKAVEDLLRARLLLQEPGSQLRGAVDGFEEERKRVETPQYDLSKLDYDIEPPPYS